MTMNGVERFNHFYIDHFTSRWLAAKLMMNTTTPTCFTDMISGPKAIQLVSQELQIWTE